MSFPDGALSKVILTNTHQYTKEFKYDRQHMPVWHSSFLDKESNQKYCREIDLGYVACEVL
jgi:hypothetical protein